LTSRFKLEFYPEINENLLNKSKELILENKDKWDAPFFADTETYINMSEINEASQDFLDERIENIIVLGTGGSIQTLLALKHLSKKKYTQ